MFPLCVVAILIVIVILFMYAMNGGMEYVKPKAGFITKKYNVEGGADSYQTVYNNGQPRDEAGSQQCFWISISDWFKIKEQTKTVTDLRKEYNDANTGHQCPLRGTTDDTDVAKLLDNNCLYRFCHRLDIRLHIVPINPYTNMPYGLGHAVPIGDTEDKNKQVWIASYGGHFQLITNFSLGDKSYYIGQINSSLGFRIDNGTDGEYYGDSNTLTKFNNLSLNKKEKVINKNIKIYNYEMLAQLVIEGQIDQYQNKQYLDYSGSLVDYSQLDSSIKSQIDDKYKEFTAVPPTLLYTSSSNEEEDDYSTNYHIEIENLKLAIKSRNFNPEYIEQRKRQIRSEIHSDMTLTEEAKRILLKQLESV